MMKSICIKGRRDLEFGNTNRPIIHDDEVLVKVKASGICGTDVHVYEGEVPLATLPVIPGHEFSGIIEKVGENIHDLHPGDKIAVEPNLFCGHCHFCRNAKKHFCENWGAVGLTRDGGFAEYCAVPRQAVYKLPKRVSFSDGAFFEPLACVLHGIERSKMAVGDTVVVLGTGSIGLIYIQALKALGAGKVIAMDIDPGKLDLAKKVGANRTLNAIEDDVESIIKEETSKRGAEVVIDAAGTKSSLAQTFKMVQDTGTIVIFGVPPESLLLPVRMYDIYRREISIVGSFTNPYTNEKALKLLETGKIRFEQILTHEISLEKVENTIIKIRDGLEDEVVVKAQISM